MLFTTSSCPKCPEAKKWMKENYPETKILVADETEEAMILSQKYHIMCVPAIVEVIDESSYKIASFEVFKHKGEK